MDTVATCPPEIIPGNRAPRAIFIRLNKDCLSRLLNKGQLIRRFIPALNQSEYLTRHYGVKCKKNTAGFARQVLSSLLPLSNA